MDEALVIKEKLTKKVNFDKPDVKNYLDVRLYLQDTYQFQKNINPLFSYNIWATQMGLHSKSYLRFAVLGQRGISLELTQKLAEFLKLSAADQEYFSLLVLFTQSKLPEQKQIFGRRLTQILRQELSTTEISLSSQILKNPLALALRNLLSYTDLPQSLLQLSQLLEVSEIELVALLQLLEEERLIEKTDVFWKATHNHIKISDKTNRETIEYHQKILQKAIIAADLPTTERYFRSLGITLGAEEYTQVLQDLDQYIKNIALKYETHEISGKRYYQFSFNLIPWTHKIKKVIC